MATIIQIDQAAVQRMLRHRDGMVGRGLDRRADRVVIRARELAPGSMPVLVSPHRIEHRGEELSAVIDSIHPATLYVVKGTRPHVIRPRVKKVLRFTVGGRTVFAKLVHHPGTKPNDFLNEALKKAL